MSSLLGNTVGPLGWGFGVRLTSSTRTKSTASKRQQREGHGLKTGQGAIEEEKKSKRRTNEEEKTQLPIKGNRTLASRMLFFRGLKSYKMNNIE
jgi:hypothetical protein